MIDNMKNELVVNELLKVVELFNKNIAYNEELLLGLISVATLKGKIKIIHNDKFIKMKFSIEYRPFAQYLELKFKSFEGMNTINYIRIYKSYKDKDFISIAFRDKEDRSIHVWFSDGGAKISEVRGSELVSEKQAYEEYMSMIGEMYYEALKSIEISLEKNKILAVAKDYSGFNKSNIEDFSIIKEMNEKINKIDLIFNDVKKEGKFFIPEYKYEDKILKNICIVIELSNNRYSTDILFDIGGIRVIYTKGVIHESVDFRDILTNDVKYRIRIKDHIVESYKDANKFKELVNLTNSTLDKIMHILSNMEDIIEHSYNTIDLTKLEDVMSKNLKGFTLRDKEGKITDGIDMTKISIKVDKELFIRRASTYSTDAVIPSLNLDCKYKDYDININLCNSPNVLGEPDFININRLMLYKNGKLLLYIPSESFFRRYLFISDDFDINNMDNDIFKAILESYEYMMNKSNDEVLYDISLLKNKKSR